MHIVIGVLSAVAGLIWAIVALQRSGVNFGDLNPFLWFRRSKWKKLYNEKPIYNLGEPLDVACVLILGVAKCEGEISSGQKQAILQIYQTEFKLSPDAAADQLLASSHLIRDEIYLVDNLSKILHKSLNKFKEAQVDSMLAMMEKVAMLEGRINEEQQKLIDATRNILIRPVKTRTGTWA